MAFAPVLPLSGVPGWSLLKRTEGDQRAQFAQSPEIAREAAYFRDNIAGAATAADLVADRRLLSVALTAFGLESELDKRALIRTALESDPADRQSFANRLADSRYRKLTEAFGYGAPGGPRVAEPDFPGRLLEDYRARSFEKAVGRNDPALRLALNARRELAAYADMADAGKTAWFSAMGDRPVREVLETALNLPASFGQLDIDRQYEEFRSRTRELYGDGSMAVFSDPEVVEGLIRRYLARDSATQGPAANTRGVAALTILRQGGAALSSLVQSRFA